MAELADDLGTIKPSRAPSPPLMPPRITDATTTSSGSDQGSTSAALANEMSSLANPRADQVERGTLIVGREISLLGQITSCNRLVVEGNVEVTLDDCRELDIVTGGLFKGTASVDSADVSGRFEGDLAVRKRLLIRASGHVAGTISYGEIEIERGGKISGSVEVLNTRHALPFLAEPAFARSR